MKETMMHYAKCCVEIPIYQNSVVRESFNQPTLCFSQTGLEECHSRKTKRRLLIGSIKVVVIHIQNRFIKGLDVGIPDLLARMRLGEITIVDGRKRNRMLDEITVLTV